MDKMKNLQTFIGNNRRKLTCQLMKKSLNLSRNDGKKLKDFTHTPNSEETSENGQIKRKKY